MLSTDELTKIHTGFEGVKKLSHDNLGFVVKPILLSYMLRTKLSYDESKDWKMYVYAQYKAIYHEIPWTNKVPLIGISDTIRTLFKV